MKSALEMQALLCALRKARLFGRYNDWPKAVLVRIASLEHIIASKRAANREKDRYVLKRLQQELGDQLKEAPAKYRTRRKK
jgi:hypothetical protein